MRCMSGGDWQSAVVPGTVYTDLLRNGNMEDPYWKDNEDSACALMEDDYEYECRFVPDEALMRSRTRLLKFDGLDTCASIYLNGELLGEPCNMHRIWEYDVTDSLREGENLLNVQFHSPLRYIAQAYKKYGNIGNDDTYEGFMHLRKAHYMFGWDWGAHLPDAGIFRSVSLLGIEEGRIGSVYIRQRHEESKVTLLLEAEASCISGRGDGSSPAGGNTGEPEQKICWQAAVTSPDGKTYRAVLADGRGALVIEEPQLWWPNGLGDQPLYDVEVSMRIGEKECDVWKKRIGLRTLTVKREKDAWGESFAHEVNGVCFFAMGADYIPEDHLLGRRSRERTQRLLEDCRLANFNSIRVWGGGFYPDDWFYDLCDELGLVVWQDFMFACSVYELTEEFEANIRQEFIDNITRLRHHASLGLWCGNNEMEMFVDERCWVTKPSEVRDYLFMYERIIPEVLRKYDPETFYWPASPSSGGAFDNPNDPDRGDVHYWKVWHGSRPFSEYRKHYFRYISEFGFQAFPSKKTIESFTDDPADWNIFSYIMEKHQRNYGANGKIMSYMQQAYRYPTDFGTLIYASQLLQADGIRYGVEHFRRNRGRCMGAVYWQLNDCWPVISWSSIDYHGRWKALHYYAKRFFAPVLVSCEEESWMTQEANMNRQHFRFEKSVRFNASNETRQDRQILLRWQVRNAQAEMLRSEEMKITVPALSAQWTGKVLLPDIDVFTEYVSFQAYDLTGVSADSVTDAGDIVTAGGESILPGGDGSMQEAQIADSTVIFSYPKYFRYENPHLQAETDGEWITVRADAYAKSVEILNEEEDLILSDNYFDMNAGVKKVRILRGKPDGLRVRSVFDIH